MKPNLHAPRPRFAAGFSLVEILVVVSIIFVLMGLGVAVFKRSGDAALGKQSQIILRESRAIASEYWTVTGYHINSSTGVTTPINWSGTFTPNNPEADSPATAPATSNERFVVAAQQLPATASMIARLDGEHLLKDTSDLDTGNGFLEIVDAWDTPILYFTKNFSSTSSALYTADSDPNKSNYVNAAYLEHPQPFFVSAGPDREMGSANPTASAAARKQAEDNLYSFKLE